VNDVNETHEKVPVVLVTPPPRINPQTLGRGPPFTRLICPYAEVVIEVAEETNCASVDLFAAFQSRPNEQFWKSDGVHLTQQGNSLVYKGILGAIGESYPQVTPMTDGNGKYGKIGVPLEGKIWSELC
jgi:lysophospholipase L1-like esterase